MADTAAHTYGGVEYTYYLPTGHQLTCEDVIDFLSQFPADTVITWFLRGEDRTDNVGLYADPSPDTPNAYAPRCGHHGNPLVWLDPALRWRCPHCFPELFPAP